jgi:transaldolase
LDSIADCGFLAFRISDCGLQNPKSTIRNGNQEDGIMTPLESLVASGTKLWLDSVDPAEVDRNLGFGATGATSNPIIIADLIKTGRFDDTIARFLRDTEDDEAVAWKITDLLVREAQAKFLPAWQRSKGDTGWVSFELDPLLDDASNPLSVEEKTKRYVELGKMWSAGHQNRMIKVPATPAGLAAIEELCAASVTLNITLVFSERQYTIARDSMWRGAQRRKSLDGFKSVYSIFVSRVDQYSKEHCKDLSPAAQGMVGIVNAKRIWRLNKQFWADKNLPLHQEMIFASTGKKFADDADWKYVEAFAGSDIETNPPATNAAVQASGRMITPKVDQMPPAEVLAEIDKKVNIQHMEETLMRAKFADPQKALIKLIGQKREQLAVRS